MAQYAFPPGCIPRPHVAHILAAKVVSLNDLLHTAPPERHAELDYDPALNEPLSNRYANFITQDKIPMVQTEIAHLGAKTTKFFAVFLRVYRTVLEGKLVGDDTLRGKEERTELGLSHVLRIIRTLDQKLDTSLARFFDAANNAVKNVVNDTADDPADDPADDEINPFPSLTLHPELRLLAYKYAFSNMSVDMKCLDCCCITYRELPHHSLALLRTCRLVRAEAIPIFYSTVNLVLHIGPADWWSAGIYRCLASIPQGTRDLFKIFTICYREDLAVGKVIKGTPTLLRLVKNLESLK